jgi:tetratricopeptide (TPR) repeat protein
MPFDYDAFLSYSTADAATVEAIAVRLREVFNLRVFLDKWCLTPGQPWQDEIEDALNRSATCVVFFGSSGITSWAHKEMRAALELRAKERILRVIPTMLPGAKRDSRTPLFLESLTWVDFTRGLDDEHAFQVLSAGICGYAHDGMQVSPAVHGNLVPRLGTRIANSILPVAQFQERPELITLRSHWSATNGGVIAIVGIGGAGKTALTCRFLQELPGCDIKHDEIQKNANLPSANGVFVWSFYDNPNIELFIEELFGYLSGNIQTAQLARETAYRLIRLVESAPFDRVLIVMDGLEVVQENRESDGGFGLLRDSSLRHLVRRVAQGGLGIRMLLTSRFPFPDLTLFQGSGYTPIEADNLDHKSAQSLLRLRGVIGTDPEINELLRHFGNHALTLDHLGTLLRDFFDGTPRRAAELPPMGTASGDAYAEFQARRLGRLFSFYQVKLPTAELKILQALCVFRLPVPISIILGLFSPDEKNRLGAPYKMKEVTVRAVLAQLRSRRLLSFDGKNDSATCAVHPSVRDYFYRTLGEAGREIHANVRDQLVSLAERPRRSSKVLDSQSLDLVEELVYHSLQAGEVDAAINAYARLIGGYRHLGWGIADFQRGLRVTALFLNAGGMLKRNVWSSGHPWHDHALFLLDLGRPKEAEGVLLRVQQFVTEASQGAEALRDKTSDIQSLEINMNYAHVIHNRPEAWFYYESIVLESLCDAMVAMGNLQDAEDAADLVIVGTSQREESESRKYRMMRRWRLQEWRTGSNPVGRRAVARSLLGNVVGATADFRICDEIEKEDTIPGEQNSSIAAYHHIYQARFLTRLGKLRSAQDLLHRFGSSKLLESCPLFGAQTQLAWADIHSHLGDLSRATECTESALAWSIQTGHYETHLLATIAKGKLLLKIGELDASHKALDAAEKDSRQSGFRIHLIDGLIASGYLALKRDLFVRASELSEEAFELSTEDQTGYKWGLGSAAHLRAEIAIQQNDRRAAESWALKSATVRQELKDPRIANTLRLLSTLSNYLAYQKIN